MRAKGCALLQGLRQWGGVSRETRTAHRAGQDMSLVWVQSERGDV
jgi:hypothetical protein